jgi:triacylglycerol lipase
VSSASIALLALLIVALVCALATVVLVVRRPAHKVRPLEGIELVPGRTGIGTPLPVVLVHGFFGFDRTGLPGLRVHYFRGIVKHLESLGCHAHAVRLPRTAAVPDRAKALVEKIEALGHDKVDIIAHSLGGLDARYALAKLGLASKVRSLVTIGTPHHGTPLANWGSSGPLGVARKAIRLIGIPLHAVDWLTPAALEKFNADVPNVPGVRYACVVGGLKQTSPALPIVAIHAYLRRVAGPNDGVVPNSSQYWGETLAEIEADHFEQVGWRLTMTRGSFDALALYAYIVARLGDVPAAAAEVKAQEKASA